MLPTCAWSASLGVVVMICDCVEGTFVLASCWSDLVALFSERCGLEPIYTCTSKPVVPFLLIEQCNDGRLMC